MRSSRPNVYTLAGLAACSFWGVSSAIPLLLSRLGLGDQIGPIARLGLIHVIGIGGILWLARLGSDEPMGVLFSLRRFQLRSLLGLSALMAGISILGSEAANWILRTFGDPQASASGVSAGGLPGDLGWWALAVVAGVVPWTEELLFRGLILDGFLDRYRRSVAILACSSLFALFHLNQLQMPLAFAAGAALAQVRIQSGSVLPCVIGHSVLNGFPLVLTWLVGEIPGYGRERTLTLQQPLEFDLIGVALVGFGVFELLWMVRRRRVRSPSTSG